LRNERDRSYRMAQNKRLHVEIALMKMAYFPYAQDFSRSDSVSSGSAGQMTEDTKKNYSREPEPLKKGPSDPRVPKVNEPSIKETDSSEPDHSTATVVQENTMTTPAQKNEDVPAEGALQPTGTQTERNRRKSKSLLPTLNGMEEIIEEVEQNDADKQIIPEDRDLLSLVQHAWNQYKNNHSSPSLATFLSDAKLDWKDDKLIITVTSRLAKSSILDQRDLFEKLREATSPLVPEIIFEIDADSAPATRQVKILSTKD